MQMTLKSTSVLFLFVLLEIGLTHAQSQNLSLNIQKTDNTEKNIQLGLLKKITFSGTDLILNYQTGSTENVGISLIQKLTFSPFTAVSNVLDDANSIAVYPNPSSNFIFFKNLPEGSSDVTVYSINGMKMLNVSAANNQVDVSRLATGIYLIKVNNQVLKFSKQ
jgi:hypothetical protein